MQTKCKKTCCQSIHGELCADVQTKCRSYKSYCNDPKHLKFMQEKCPITCGTCGLGARQSVILKGVELGGSSVEHDISEIDQLGGLGLLVPMAPPGF